MYLFTYGILTNSNYMDPNAVRIGPAVLHGHKWRVHAHATVEIRVGASLTGIVWEIDDAMLESLDYRECYPAYYSRKCVEVVRPDGEKLVAWVYYMVDPVVPGVPSSAYMDAVTKGYAEDNLPLPEVLYGRKN